MIIVTDELVMHALRVYYGWSADDGELRPMLKPMRDALEAVADRLQMDDNDELMCCNGQDCGCQGLTKGQYRAYLLGINAMQTSVLAAKGDE